MTNELPPLPKFDPDWPQDRQKQYIKDVLIYTRTKYKKQRNRDMDMEKKYKNVSNDGNINLKNTLYKIPNMWANRDNQCVTIPIQPSIVNGEYVNNSEKTVFVKPQEHLVDKHSSANSIGFAERVDAWKNMPSINVSPDRITISYKNGYVINLPSEKSPPPKYKYKEGDILQDMQKYVDRTYGEHYKKDDLDMLDVWIAKGTASTTCLDTAQKYLWRYGSKNGNNKTDLLKAMHYIMFTLYNDHYKPESE